MSKMVIEKGYFSSRDEVMADIGKTGFWPHTFVSGKSPELPIHYHDHDVIGYVIEGETYLLDEEGERVLISSGDRLDIPKGAWHAEGEVTDRVVYIVSLRDPIDLLQGIIPKEPKGPFPSFD
ncbi:MAG: cupin domain-containing protein [Candidatus Binatia bacterium]|nr:cupin domain-containing protein [Candidatus Binatia bacterium]